MRQDGQDTPETDDAEPKSTPSSSRPASSLSISTCQSGATPTPTPPPIVNRTMSQDVMGEYTPAMQGGGDQGSAMKSPNDDEIVRAIAKPPKKRKTIDEGDLESVSQNVNTNVTASAKRHCINLGEWVNQRVLAKKNQVFQSGVIKTVTQNRSVGVLFDGDRDVTMFSDVLDSSSCLIVSDNPPPAVMISNGCAVCVRVSLEQNVFYEGQVMEKKVQQQYRVRITHTHLAGKEVQVSRASLRLLQPPWHEDLEDALPEQPTPPPPTPTHTAFQYQVS